jgi:type II secretory pathway pseudopilin PulG
MSIELIVVLTIFALLAALNVVIVVKYKKKMKLTFENFANEYSDRFLDILTGVVTILSVNKDKFESEEAYEKAVIEAATKEIIDTYTETVDPRYAKIFNQELIERILTDIVNRCDLLGTKKDKIE